MPRNGGCKRLEKPIQKEILRLLKSRGAWPVKVIAANINGCPDILCCYKGLFVALEVKATSGRVTPLQQYNNQKINDKAEGIARVVRSAEEVEVLLEEIDGKNNQV